jgi:hypothetical protein
MAVHARDGLPDHRVEARWEGRQGNLQAARILGIRPKIPPIHPTALRVEDLHPGEGGFHRLAEPETDPIRRKGEPRARRWVRLDQDGMGLGGRRGKGGKEGHQQETRRDPSSRPSA